LTKKSNLIGRLDYDLAQFCYNLVVIFFFWTTLQIGEVHVKSIYIKKIMIENQKRLQNVNQLAFVHFLKSGVAQNSKSLTK